MIVLDASVLIAYVTREDVHHDGAVELITGAVAAGEDLLVNPVTLAEVLVSPTRAGRLDEAMAALAEIGVTEAPFPPGAAQTLARLRVTGVKMPDCCVLLTALNLGGDLASFDDRLVRAALQQGVRPRP